MSDPADPNPQNPPGTETGDGLPRSEEFERWLRADPANWAKFEALLKRADLDDCLSDLPPEARDRAQATLAKREEYRNLAEVTAKMEKLREMMRREVDGTSIQENLAACNALTDEAVDALLETPEPHRTTFLQALLPLREKLRAMRGGD